jgi:hypothetical protein
MLRAMAVGAGAVVFEPALRAQAPAMDRIAARIDADLRRHASFGSKRSAAPGDRMTANWIAERLKAAGYIVAAHDFPAP